jgi:hypothetical protein
MDDGHGDPNILLSHNDRKWSGRNDRYYQHKYEQFK